MADSSPFEASGGSSYSIKQQFDNATVFITGGCRHCVLGRPAADPLSELLLPARAPPMLHTQHAHSRNLCLSDQACAVA